MSKTTFEGYVPSLKERHEATIVSGKAIESKGGSIRYMLQGEYNGRKTLPKTVSKADFESVYGFDAKEAEAVIITGKEAIGMGKKDVVKGFIKGKEDKDDFTPNQIVTFPHEIGTGNLENHADTVGEPSPASVEPPAPSETPFPQEPSNENFSAFGLFGDKDEEEESEEPKTQEFTVVLEEGDKLELTDVPETVTGENGEDKEESEEKDEKDAEMDDYTDEQLLKVARLDIENQIDNGTMYAIGEEPEPFDDGENFYTIVTLYAQYHKDEDKAEKILWEMFRQEYPQYLGTEVKEAVSAKVTRPVKEEEEPEEESDEGLLTPKNLAIGALGVGALALALGAEDDESDYWAGEEYGVMNAEGFYEAEVNVGEKRIMSRKDYDIDNDLSGFSNMEIGDIDLDDYEEEITDSVEDEIIEAIRESVDDAMPISDGESISSSVNVDTEIEMTVPISGDIDYDWTANETHEDEQHDDEWDAEDSFESESDGYAYAYTKGHNDGINDEVIYRPSIATDKGRNIYKKILKQKAETFEAEGWVLTSPKMGRSGVFTTKEDAEKVKNWHIRYAPPHYENETLLKIVKANANDIELGTKLSTHSKGILLGSETVGNPSPSGPSSTPEPAEATGSEPSNENFESPTKGNLKLIGGISLVAAGLFALGKSDWVADTLNKYMK